MLDDYIKHLRTNPKSLLAKIYGVFTIESERFPKISVMLQENLTSKATTSLGHLKHSIQFDLKGSFECRYEKESSIKKDLNFIEMKTNKHKPLVLDFAL